MTGFVENSPDFLIFKTGEWGAQKPGGFCRCISEKLLMALLMFLRHSGYHQVWNRFVGVLVIRLRAVLGNK
jgi:hypothetical protein